MGLVFYVIKCFCFSLLVAQCKAASSNSILNALSHTAINAVLIVVINEELH